MNTRILITSTLFVAGIQLAQAQNQFKTSLYTESLWYFNPAATGANAPFTVSLQYSFEPSMFTMHSLENPFEAKQYSNSRALIGLESRLPIFKKYDQINLSMGVATNLLGPNHLGEKHIRTYPNGGQENYKELGGSLSNQFNLKGGHQLSIGASYRWSKYKVSAAHNDYINAEGGLSIPDNAIPVTKHMQMHVLNFGLYYQNEDQSIRGGFNLDNAPNVMSETFAPGLPQEFNPSYFGQEWSLSGFYTMRITLGSNFSIDPNIAMRINRNVSSYDIGGRLYFKSKFFVGAALLDNGNGFATMAGIEYKRFEFAVSCGNSNFRFNDFVTVQAGLKFKLGKF